MKRLLNSAAILVVVSHATLAAPSDIVPRGSALNDWMSALAAGGYLGARIHASDFTSEDSYTRAQLAEILGEALADPDIVKRLGADKATAPLALEAVGELKQELDMDNSAMDDLRDELTTKSLGYTGSVQPEYRASTDGSQSSGTFLTYRAVIGGQISPGLSYVVSGSNWWEDWRRNFYNDVGSKDFTGLNEAYVKYVTPHGLDIRVGQMNERWGPGLRGASLISDNVPPFDEIRASFPFSLGSTLGRSWRYTQFASTFDDYSGRRYFEARRLETDFNRHVTFDYEEAFKADYSASLEATPFPFLIFKGFNLPSFETNYNYNGDLGLTYSANPSDRVYGQLFIDDYKSPFKGRFLGLSLGAGGNTPERIGYLVGATHDVKTGTSMTVEYSYSDPTSELFQNNNATWEHAQYQFIGMPTGENTREISGRIARKLTPKLSVAVEGRDRQRRDDSFPAPDSQYVGTFAYYNLDLRSTFGISYNNYRQEAFPYSPGQPGYPVGDPLLPSSQGNPGENITIKQVDVTYQYTF